MNKNYLLPFCVTRRYEKISWLWWWRFNRFGVRKWVPKVWICTYLLVYGYLESLSENIVSFYRLFRSILKNFEGLQYCKNLYILYYNVYTSCLSYYIFPCKSLFFRKNLSFNTLVFFFSSFSHLFSTSLGSLSKFFFSSSFFYPFSILKSPSYNRQHKVCLDLFYFSSLLCIFFY